MTTFSFALRSRIGTRFGLLLTSVAVLCGLFAADASAQTSASSQAKRPVRLQRPPTNPAAREKWFKQLELESRIALGKELFHRKWQSQEPNGSTGDGLGPLFNERSCVACHHLGASGGAGPGLNNVQLLVVQRLPPGDKWESTTLAQRDYLLPTATSDTFLLHRFGTTPGYEKWREERLSFAKGIYVESLSNDARAKHLHSLGLELPMVPKSAKTVGSGYLTETASSELMPIPPSLIGLKLEEINTTALFGAGLIDKVQEETLVAVAKEQPPVFRGRVPYTAERTIGRFGWKGQNGTLLAFNTGACAAELGLDTHKLRQAKAPVVGQDVKPYANLFNISKGIDVSDNEIQAMTEYVASLPAPIRPDGVRNAIDVRYGEQHFTDVGCAICHRRDVGDLQEVYSDLLLHDVGLQSSAATYYASVIDLVGNGDPKRSADPAEFRTPPLWGVADSAPYLHDGRAATLEQAITMHGGQAATTVTRYKQLREGQRKQLLTFLGSLRAPRE